MKSHKNATSTRSLSGEDIELTIGEMEGFLRDVRQERENILRIRLSLEEALLRWRDDFGEEKEVTVSYSSRWGRPRIRIQLWGAENDPTVSRGEGYDLWAESPLTAIGLAPRYAYRSGCNVLQLDLTPIRSNPVIPLLLALLLGSLIGVIGITLVPENIRADLMGFVFVPLYEAFFRLLNLTAGPVIFLSLLWALCGVGNPSVGARRRNMFLRCMSFSLLLTVSTLAVSAFIFHPNQVADAVRGKDFAGVLDALLQLIPSDLFSPFIDGESAQILFLALLLGSAILVMGSRSDRLKEIVEEGNNLGSLLAEWVSVISPVVIAIMAVIEMWRASFRMLTSSIWPLLLLVVFYAVMLAVSVLCTSVKYRVSVKTLWNKLKPSCMIALRHASVNAAYGASESCCANKLGLSSDFVSYALPSGLVLFMPAGIVEMALFLPFLARYYQIPVSLTWYVKALIMTVALVVATPPIAGIGLLGFAVIFSWLAIPQEALATVMIVDIAVALFVSAVNLVMLMMFLIFEADRQGILDKDRLRSPN